MNTSVRPEPVEGFANATQRLRPFDKLRTGQAQPEPVFQWPLRVYWEDTDAGGIVFYANYLKFFERSRTEWLRSLGIAQQQLKDSTGGTFVVNETSVRYLRPCRLDDELLVTARMVEAGRASMTIAQQVLLKSGDATQLVCEGTIRIGWVNAATLQPARIPASILDRLKPFTQSFK